MTQRRNVPGSSPVRRDRLIREHVHDTYKMRGKLPEPAVCPRCRAVFHKGRWQWADVPADAQEVVCAACHRVEDRCPAGYLTLTGPFFEGHADEILHLARNVEEREKAAHPLRRIMATERHGQGVEITTTDMGLARSIGDAIQHAYKGELDYQYTDESSLLRVSWAR